jgi:hypothetical protein
MSTLIFTRLTGDSSSQDLFSQFYQTFQILPDTANFQGIFHYKLALTFLLVYFLHRAIPCKIAKQVKKSMPTYDEKSRENSLCLEDSEMSDKTGKISPMRKSHQST